MNNTKNNDVNIGLDKSQLVFYDFNNLQTIFNAVLERYLQTRDKHFKSFLKAKVRQYIGHRNIAGAPKQKFHVRNSEKAIIEMYYDLNQLFSLIAGGADLVKKQVIIDRKFSYQSLTRPTWQYKSLEYIKQQVEKDLSFAVKSFLIHGSYASQDFIESWSDLDTKVILKNAIFENASDLKRFRKRIRKLCLICDKIDPLSHHRFSFLTELDLNYYPISFLPLAVYEKSLVLFGDSMLVFRVRDSQAELFELMQNFVSHFRNRVKNKNYSRNLRHFKDDLSRIMLWPSLLVQSRGIDCAKKESFSRAKKEFPNFDFSVVDRATEIMKSWYRPNALRYCPNFLIKLLPFWLSFYLVSKYRAIVAAKALPITNDQVESITYQADQLFSESCSLVQAQKIKEQIDLADYEFANLPRYLETKDYQEVCDQIVARLKNNPNIKSIYRSGGPWNPGISDLDIAIIIKDINGEKIAMPKAEELSDKAKFIFLHGCDIYTEELFKKLCFIASETNKRDIKLLYGEPIGFDYPSGYFNETDFEDITAITIFNYLINKFVPMLTKTWTNRVDVRACLGQYYSLTYILDLISELNNQTLASEYYQRIKKLKQEWLGQKKEDNLKELIALMKMAEDVFAEIVKELDRYIKQRHWASNKDLVFKNRRFYIDFTDSWSKQVFFDKFKPGYLKVKKPWSNSIIENYRLVLPSSFAFFFSAYGQGQGRLSDLFQKSIKKHINQPVLDSAGITQHIAISNRYCQANYETNGMVRLPFNFGFVIKKQRLISRIGDWYIGLKRLFNH